MKIRKQNLLKSLENLEKIINKSMEFVPLLNLPASSVNNSILRSTEQSRETLSTPGVRVIGRNRDRDHIVNLLREDFPESCSNTKCYSVIGIWGMGGSGKTTLAQFVCEYEKEAKYFDLVIWTHVSQNFNLHSIFRRIWESAFKEDCPNCDSIEGLNSKLREKLRGRMFFLVLDDVWCNTEVSALELQQLFAPLQTGKRGSKILVTARIEGAARTLGATNPIQLRQLDHDEFLNLFMSEALRDLQNSNKHLEEKLTVIAEQIATKLHRSPLAATTVANLLRNRLDPEFWLTMLNQDLLDETIGALLFSYQYLPPPLQRCFAFCSLFPKGHEFDQDYLVGLWIGEGFIESDGSNRHVRDIGNGYIQELISRSFLQVREYWGLTKYVLHDLLHDLAVRVSQGECFIIESGKETKIPKQTRHLFVEDDMFEEYVRKICKLKNLRTIIICRSWSPKACVKRKDLDAIFKESRKLYVVDINSYGHSNSDVLEGVPHSVVYLENLRYLNIGCRICQGKDIMKYFARMYQLRVLCGIYGYLWTKEKIHQIPDIGRLLLFQQLECFSVGKEREFGLKQLEHLRELFGRLSINCLDNVNSSEEARLAKLSDKKGLRTLQLGWENTAYHVVGRDQDADILDELCPPTQIKNLGIKRYCGKRCPKWFSEYNKNTTHLKELRLVDCPFLEALPEIDNLIFLQSLIIDRLPRLKWWSSLPPYLVNLSLKGCDSLAFGCEEDLKIIMSAGSRDQAQIDNELKKLVDGDFFNIYLEKQQKWESLCQLKEVNGELYLPLTLEKLVMQSCFIADKILASSLQNHTLLTHLELCDIFPLTCIPREVLTSLTNLQFLKIEKCLMLTTIGGLETLSSLEKLIIWHCPCLTIEISVVGSSSFLKELTIKSCKPSDDMFKALTSLEILYIYNCPTIKSPDFSNLKSLCSLTLSHCENLVSLGGLNELSNLEILDVSGCMKLQCFSDANKLPPVKVLTISELSTLQFISRDGLSSLVSLRVEFSEEEYFTEEEYREMLPQLSSLESIEFYACHMKSMPNLLSLCSLTKLQINDCKGLTTLPELPPSVQSIRLTWCSDEFKRSCEDNNHPNWQNISHIPEKYIRKWS